MPDMAVNQEATYNHLALTARYQQFDIDQYV